MVMVVVMVVMEEVYGDNGSGDGDDCDGGGSVW
jgi:hypothetical protein